MDPTGACINTIYRLIQILLPLAGVIFLLVWLLIQNYKVDKKMPDLKRRRFLMIYIPLLVGLGIFIYMIIVTVVNKHTQITLNSFNLNEMFVPLVFSLMIIVPLWTVVALCGFIYFIFKKQINIKKIWTVVIIGLVIVLIYLVMPSLLYGKIDDLCAQGYTSGGDYPNVIY